MLKSIETRVRRNASREQQQNLDIDCKLTASMHLIRFVHHEFQQQHHHHRMCVVSSLVSKKSKSSNVCVCVCVCLVHTQCQSTHDAKINRIFVYRCRRSEQQMTKKQRTARNSAEREVCVYVRDAAWWKNPKTFSYRSECVNNDGIYHEYTCSM